MFSDSIAKLARGSEQRYWLCLMFAPEGCHSPIKTLKGKAKSYASLYARSFANLAKRLQAHGVTVSRVPGPRGGEHGARYFAQHGQQQHA